MKVCPFLQVSLFCVAFLVSRLGFSAATYQSLLFHSYKILFIVNLYFNGYYSVCAALLSGICSSIQASSGSPIAMFYFTRWYFDLRSVPLQLLEGFEGKGTFCYLCDNSLHIKIVSQKSVLFQNVAYLIPSLHCVPEDCLGDDQCILGI